MSVLLRTVLDWLLAAAQSSILVTTWYVQHHKLGAARLAHDSKHTITPFSHLWRVNANALNVRCAFSGAGVHQQSTCRLQPNLLHHVHGKAVGLTRGLLQEFVKASKFSWHIAHSRTLQFKWKSMLARKSAGMQCTMGHWRHLGKCHILAAVLYSPATGFSGATQCHSLSPQASNTASPPMTCFGPHC